MAAGMRKARHKGGVDKKKWMKAVKEGVSKMQSGSKTDLDSAAGRTFKPTAKGTNRW